MKRRKSYNKYSRINNNDTGNMNVVNVGNTKPMMKDIIKNALALGIATGAMSNGGYMNEINNNRNGDDD